MEGVEALFRAAAALERINPEDRFCPFCRSLLALIRPLIEKDLRNRGYDRDTIELIYQLRVQPRNTKCSLQSVLDELPRAQAEDEG